jgi:serine/threonine protein phosphatase PrpC
VLRAFGVTEQGPVRSSNQDCFAIHDDLGLCVVADGMGGHNAGEVAARIVVQTVVDHVRRANGQVSAAARPSLHPFGADPALSESANTLRNAILLAHVQVLEAAGSAARYAGMGTTVVAAHVAAGRLAVAHVGDSRLYVLSRGAIRPLTTDDSWIAALLAREPDANPQLFKHHPMRHALTNVVGGRAQTDVHVTESGLSGGELLLLTTDGVHGVLDDPRLAALASASDDPRTIARAIVDAALAEGTHDNATAVVARYVT